MSDKINILIVDDSAFMRKLINDFLEDHPRIQVIGTARNGEDAIKKIKELRPHVVTMDVEMPIMNGLEALKIIMKEIPLPVVMLSSTTREGAENTLIAIQNGAFDFIAKPSGAISLDLYKIKEELIEKVISASRANISRLIGTKIDTLSSVPKTQNYSKIELEKSQLKQVNPVWEKKLKKLICIGTSTGGPRALQNVLTKLPKGIEAPLFIVQHMPPSFTKSLATRLDSLSEIKVKEAEDGEIVQKGVAYIAPGGFHLKLKQMGTALAIQIDQSPLRNGHRPAVDVLFESISELQGYAKIAVIMTGMGTDGSQGLLRLKENGLVKAIAESQNTSIVYGMPKAAVATKLIDEVQDVEKIAETILKYV
ncbi:chemotaxis response regulator protein-glutamate methylesterase [Bacillus sp. CGMCC 1.16607]|uniref:protein-glutamate methylesterase/protein-glutamine glutaminase n=1 Tax=Bacillus sp. CGMCC 1.16607 TaxID=3351842 RepID=UPI00362BA15C